MLKPQKFQQKTLGIIFPEERLIVYPFTEPVIRNLEFLTFFQASGVSLETTC